MQALKIYFIANAFKVIKRANTLSGNVTQRVCHTVGQPSPAAGYTWDRDDRYKALLTNNLVNTWWVAGAKQLDNLYQISDKCEITNEKCPNNLSTSETQPDKCSLLRTSLREAMMKPYLSTLAEVTRVPFGFCQSGQCIGCHIKQTQIPAMLNENRITELCLHYYVAPTESTRYFDSIQNMRLQWWKKYACHPSKFSAVEITDSLGDYREVHIQYEHIHGKETLETVQRLGESLLQQQPQFDRKQHMAKFHRKKVLPHLIESCTAVEKGVLAYFFDAYHKPDGTSQNNGTSDAVLLKLHPHLAPYKVAVTIKGSKNQDMLKNVAARITLDLKEADIMVADVLGKSKTAMEKRCNELGIPWRVVLTEETLQTGGVKLYNRDTKCYESFSILSLPSVINDYVKIS